MNIKFATVAAVSAALLAGQATAQQAAPVQAPVKAAVGAKQKVNPVRRAAAPIGRANGQLEDVPLEFLYFLGTGTALGVIVYRNVKDSNDPNSP